MVNMFHSTCGGGENFSKKIKKIKNDKSFDLKRYKENS